MYFLLHGPAPRIPVAEDPEMRRISMIALAGVVLATLMSTAKAAPCLIVTLTGTQGGPSVFNGQAGAGTLVSYGDDSNNCGAMRLQFDAGRGTNMRLSQINVTPVQLRAIFLTHIHGDHTEGLPDVMMLRWYLKGPKIDIVCSADAISASGFTNSCRNYISHIADAFLQSGEIAERRSEDSARLAAGPADLANMLTFDPKEEPQVVWASGDVEVSAIRSAHIAGHASYRRRRQQRYGGAATHSLHVRSGGKVGKRGDRHRAFGDPSCARSGPREWVSGAELLSPELGE
jgi:ribonuclease Z